MDGTEMPVTHVSVNFGETDVNHVPGLRNWVHPHAPQRGLQHSYLLETALRDALGILMHPHVMMVIREMELVNNDTINDS